MSNNNQAPLIAHVIYKLGTGGLENGLINLINHMPVDKYRHMIICLKGSTQFSKRLKRKDVKIVDLEKKEGQDWGSFVTFYRLLKHYKVDMVHTRNLAAIEYQVPTFLAGVKYRVHSEHGWDVFDPEGKNKKYQWLRGLLSPLIKIFIPLSLHLQSYLTDKVHIPKHKIQRICNGVDMDKFYPQSPRPALYGCPFVLDEKNIYIGTVGRMHGVKDQLTLVRAFILLLKTQPELKGKLFLFLIGDGPLKQEAAELLTQNKLIQSVWLAGERKDIADVMRVLDIFVLPSQAEGISNTILEAMATSLPIIATAVGGNLELVKEGESGMLVPPSSPEAMKEAILALVTNKEKRLKQGKKSHQRVLEKFSIGVMVNNYINVYDSLIVKRKQ